MAAAIHRGWLDLRGAVPGGGKAVVTAVRQGEAEAIAAYQDALAMPMPPQLEQLARTQLESIKRIDSELALWQTSRAA